MAGPDFFESPGFFNRIRSGLTRTRTAVVDRIADVVGGRRLDDDTLEAIEEILISADVGLDTSLAIVDGLRTRARETPDADVFHMLQAELEAILAAGEGFDASFLPARPYVLLVVGVNGVGKTTTIGKLGQRYAEAGRKVIMAAGDTFRAGAVSQLQVWAERSGADIIRAQQGADPGAVVFDAMEAAKARDADVLLVDTAGRLHTKVNLMEELKKVRRSLAKACDGAPHGTLLVLDSTTGQNALVQAKTFHQAVPLTGLVLTKLDSTARGGIAFALRRELDVPIRLIGVGEGIDDLQSFDGGEFVRALLARE
ncbi:MAG: signal recognition particle-docking protein FtsY [Candidatus Latescibacterota bacterium]